MSYSETTKNFFENIRQLRRKHDLTLEEMAARLRIEVRELELLEQDIMPRTLSLTFLEYLYPEFGIPSARLLLPPDDPL